MAESLDRVEERGIKLSVEMVCNGEAAHPVGGAAGASEGRKGNAVVPKISSPKSSPSTYACPRTDCRDLARKLLGEAVLKSQQDQWGLLTALSDKAKKRSQGSNIILHHAEHVLGRVVTETSFQFDSPAVSGKHCTLVRKLVSVDGRVKTPDSDPAAGDMYATFIRDSSSNGTYINKERLKKNGAEVRLRHGDILSLVSQPELDNAFAFVFREVVDDSAPQHVKRKASVPDHGVEGSSGELKRLRGPGVGGTEGPVSLDDVRRLQKSNEELRQKLEAQVLEIEKIRGEYRAAQSRHLVELSELRTSVTEVHVQQIEEVRHELVKKTEELEESTAVCVQQQTTIEDLNHRLAAAAQSRVDAEEAIRSHASSIAELKKRLDDEFSHHQKERAEWEANLEAAVERTRVEAADELKRHSEASARMQKQQQDVIADLQEADKENRRLADSLRTKLETERQVVVTAEEKVRRLGLQLQEERLSTESASKRAAEFEEELRQLQKELVLEKTAKEAAATKVTSLELAMETASRDLTLEKQRLQGARERIVLRETQLRAFYSTAELVQALQQKQQEQLKAMLRTLEDGDGEGEYSQCKKTSPPCKSADVANESVIDNGKSVLGLASKQTASSPETGVLEKEKVLCAVAGNADHRVADEDEGSDQETEPYWMDEDAQQDEDGIEVSNFPSMSKRASAGATDLNPIVDQDNETKVLNGNDTQLVEYGATTQLLADTFQEIGSGECGVSFINENTQLTVIPAAPVHVSIDPLGSDSVVGVQAILEGRGSAGADGDQVEKDSVAVATMEIDGDFQEPSLSKCQGTRALVDNEALPEHSLNARGLAVAAASLEVGSGMFRAQCETQQEKRDNQHTMCTEDLLTSEALGVSQTSGPFEDEVGSHQLVRARMDSVCEETQLQREGNENTMCTDDLLASEVAGSWAVGTQASVHADNDSLGSDERNQTGIEEAGSQVVVNHPPASRPRPYAQHILLEEVLHFADPVNSQNSLSPATTNPVHNEREALNEMLDIVDPGFGNLPGMSRIGRHQSEIEDSTTDEEDENEVVNASSEGSQPLNPSPSVSVRS